MNYYFKNKAISCIIKTKTNKYFLQISSYKKIQGESKTSKHSTSKSAYNGTEVIKKNLFIQKFSPFSIFYASEPPKYQSNLISPYHHHPTPTIHLFPYFIFLPTSNHHRPHDENSPLFPFP